MSAPAEICFVIGMGRSGTTLLAKLLNQHPKIHGTPEAVFLIFFLNAWKNKKNFTEKDIDLVFEQIKWFSLSHPWAGWEFDLEKAKTVTHDFVKQSKPGYVELCLFIYNCFVPLNAAKNKAAIIADKNPSYTLFADKIAAAIPTAKFIYIVRDYRANILSRKQNVDLRSPEVRLNAQLWNFYNGRALQFYRNNPEKIIMLRYEDLVSDSLAEMTKVFNFLGLSPEEMIWDEPSQFSEIKKEGHSIPEGHEQRFSKKYHDLNKPVNTDRLEAWKTELNQVEIEACDAICQPLGAQLGYNPVSNAASSLKYLNYYLKALSQIEKEDLIYYLSPAFKLNRLKKAYTRLGLAKK